MKKPIALLASAFLSLSPVFAGDPANASTAASAAPTPQPLPADFVPPQATPSTPSTSNAHPPVLPQTTGPTVPFNAVNKQNAKTIYQLIKQIQGSEFSPETNLSAISKLQETVAQTDFSSIPQLHDYIQASLTLNTLRSKDIKIQRGDVGKSDHEDSHKASANGSVGILALSAGANVEKAHSQKEENQNSTDVSISSQNDPAVLDHTRQQQAVAYGLLLNELKRLGFSRPIDPSDIYGRWRWQCKEDSATYEFDFRDDGTLYVRLITDNPDSRMGRFANKGRGQWKLDYRSLSLEMNDVNLAGFWRQHPLIFFTDREIVSIDGDKMLLATDEDNELKKIADRHK